MSTAGCATCANCCCFTTTTWSKRWPRTMPVRNAYSSTRACRPTARPMLTWRESSTTTTARSWPSASSVRSHRCEARPRASQRLRKARQVLRRIPNSSGFDPTHPVIYLDDWASAATLRPNTRKSNACRWALIFFHEQKTHAYLRHSPDRIVPADLPADSRLEDLRLAHVLEPHGTH